MPYGYKPAIGQNKGLGLGYTDLGHFTPEDTVCTIWRIVWLGIYRPKPERFSG